ncbi:MAG TPA: N-acetylmuramoyl-L-alanine amidase [Thermomicrobiales bacterium]|nr:N-acetylmuramoyl-L-alanine amidase [Thermomicrobiales bacterium]
MIARSIRAVLIVAVLLPLFGTSGDAAGPWNRSFARTWARTDRPVADLLADRTWMWGPEAFTPGLLEPYAGAPNGQRLVQYYDKSRMEITTDPAITPASAWYVSNGLLAKELITGLMQLGDEVFEPHLSAEINVAGDPDDPTGPTYWTFASVLNVAPPPDGAPIVQRITRAGLLPDDPGLAARGVTAAHRVQVAGIDHQIASPFWAFMNGSALVYQDAAFRTAPLFENPFYATGFPITEAYWSRIKLKGVYSDVLIQCFERRCLTYTPDNPEGWKVEAGNVGRHYYEWRYAASQPAPAPPDDAPVIVLDAGHDSTTGGANGIEYQDTLRTALATRDALEAAGYTVFLTRPGDDTVLYGDPALMPANAGSMPLDYNQGYAHTTRALQFEPDLYISLHYNGSSSPDAGGMTIYYCDYGGTQNAGLAVIIRDELLAALRSQGYEPPYANATEDGAIGKSYGHLATLGNVYSAPFVFEGDRLAGVPSVLVEPLFETNPTERALIQDDATIAAFAQAYVRAANRYFGR